MYLLPTTFERFQDICKNTFSVEFIHYARSLHTDLFTLPSGIISIGSHHRSLYIIISTTKLENLLNNRENIHCQEFTKNHRVNYLLFISIFI
jgi:hypothetical protein